MTPGQAIALLSGDWPPKIEQHWPPRDKSKWRPAMALVGRIEAVMTLPRPEGSKHRGEPYTALYVRREPDHRLVMFHGWHTAAEDLDGMHPAPGLLFAAVYRGRRDDGFEDFKFLVTPYDLPARAGDQQTRQDTGQAERRRSTQAPEGEGASPSSPSGSNGRIDLRRITSVAIARAIVKGQSEEWRAAFQQLAEELRESGEAEKLSELEGWRRLIARTDAALTTGEAA